MFPCQRLSKPSPSRRQWLQNAACGFGAVALSAMWAEEGRAIEEQDKGPNHPLTPNRLTSRRKPRGSFTFIWTGAPRRLIRLIPSLA